MARKKNFTSRRLGMESLESRQLMTVFVDVNVEGDLILTGDGQADQVQIVQEVVNGVPIAGSYFIAGQNGTVVIGTDNGYVDGVTDDILINLNGNNDRLTLGNGNNGDFIVPDDLVVNMGLGADVVNADRVTVRDDATITTGDGNDSVAFKGTVGGLAGVDGGNNDLLIDTGARADNVSLQNTFVRRNLVVNTGTDNFTDVVDMLIGNIGGNTSINTGGGSDTVRISDVGFNNALRVNTGAGNDAVTLNRVEVDQFFTDLGSGNDTLTLRDNFFGRATLNGGTGTDTLNRINNLIGELSPPPRSFERILPN